MKKRILPVTPPESPAQVFSRFAEELFSPSAAHFQRSEFSLSDRASQGLIVKKLITLLASIGAAYVYAALSNDYYDNPDPTQRSWIPEDQRTSMKDWSFYFSFFVNTLISMYCVVLVFDQLLNRKKQNEDIIPARVLLTQTDLPLRVRILNASGQFARIILTIFAFFLGLSNLRAFSLTFTNFLKILSCAINAPITYVSLMQYSDFALIRHLTDTLRFQKNAVSANTNKIARALQSYIDNQRIQCENNGYEACRLTHERLKLTALSPNDFRSRYQKVIDEASITPQLKDTIIQMHHYVLENDLPAFSAAKVRLLFQVLTTMGTPDTRVLVDEHASLLSHALPRTESNHHRILKNIAYYAALTYYCGFICVLSGIGYPANAAIGIQLIWQEKNWQQDAGFQTLYWLTFLINFVGASGLSFTSGLATFEVLLELLKDAGFIVFVKLPKVFGYPGYPDQFGSHWHTTRSLDYHLSKGNRSSTPVLWLLANCTILAASSLTWPANVYVNESSIVPFFQNMGCSSEACITFFTGVKNQLNYAAVIGAIAVNFYFSALFAIAALVSLLYLGKMDLKNETKRKVRETFQQIKGLEETIGSMSHSFVTALLLEENALLPENVEPVLPQQSIRFFRETVLPMQQLQSPPDTSLVLTQ